MSAAGHVTLDPIGERLAFRPGEPVGGKPNPHRGRVLERRFEQRAMTGVQMVKGPPEDPDSLPGASAMFR